MKFSRFQVVATLVFLLILTALAAVKFLSEPPPAHAKPAKGDNPAYKLKPL